MRLLRSLAAVVLVAAVVPFVMAVAQPVHAATGPYGGNAFVDLVHLDLIESGTTRVADVSVAPARADVLSTGLAAPNAPARSYARGTNLDLRLVSGAINVAGQLSVAEQKSPPNNANPVVDELVQVPASPLLTALVSRATAHTRWRGDTTCVAPGTPIALGQSEVADARVLPTAPTGQPPGSTVALHNRQGSTVYTKSTVGLVNVAGSPNKGVQSVAHTQLTALTLFEGTANETTINVLAPPTVTAVATGQPGGAKVTYTEPILQIVRNGVVTGELNATSINQTITVPNGVLKLSIGTLTKTESPDGTKATGSAALLYVELLAPPTPGQLINPFSIAAGTVSASVPVGGVECPGDENPLREAHKDVSTADAQPGSTFNYTIAVPNRGACTLTKVKVVDTITGPAGTTIVSTVPPANKTEGLVMTWDDIGPIAPNETKVITITVKVPDNAPAGEVYKNHMDVTALCDGVEYAKGDDVIAPTVGPGGSGSCDLSNSNESYSHKEVFPGESFNYYLHLFNTGGGPCENIAVNDPLTGKIEFRACTDGCTGPAGTKTWTIPKLDPGQSQTLVLTVIAAPDAPIGRRLPNGYTATPASGRGANARTEGPLVSGRSVLNPPNPPRRAEVLPATGADGTGVAALAVLGLGGALAWLRRRVALTA